MDDLEITKRCAEKMGYTLSPAIEDHSEWYKTYNCIHVQEQHRATRRYYPLHSDAQAMALLILLLNSGKRVVIENNAMNCATYGKLPIMCVGSGKIYDVSTPDKMRRAICECVANLPD